MTTITPAAATGIGRRWLILIPVASIMYLLAFFDRTNLSLVLPYMGKDLDLSATDKGLVNGIFFLGYIILQVPAALFAQRWSAKYTVMLLMILWGLAAIGTGLVQNTGQLMGVRFILGLFEGGVQPATLVLISKWFPQNEKARASGFWLLCLPIASIIAAPITGLLLTSLNWRTVLVLEGFPPIIWAFVWFALVAERPRNAKWLPSAERDGIESELKKDEATKQATIAGSVRYRDVIRNKKVLALIAAWFLYNTGFYGYTLWLPTVMTTLAKGSSEALIGLFTAVPYVFGLAFMIVISVRTDRLGSGRATVIVPLSIAAAALLVGQFIGIPGLQFALLCVVAAGLYVHGAFFALPPLLLRTEILAVGLGLIGGIGNLGGFLGPYIVGGLTDATGSSTLGFVLVAVALLGAGICMAAVTPKRSENAVLHHDPAVADTAATR